VTAVRVELEELVPIGGFSRLSGLTIKALRHYDEIGLLEPARVDGSTGRRFYAVRQVREGEALRTLRELEVPLEEIRTLLRLPRDEVREQLAVHRARLEGRVVETQRIIERLDRLIDGKETLVPGAEEVRVRFEMSVEHVPEERVLQIRERCRVDDAAEVIPRALGEIEQYMHELGVPVAAVNFCICPFPDDEGTHDLTVGWPVDRDVPGRGPIEAATLPATRALVLLHQGPYSELSRSYRLMSEVMREHGLTPAGDPIERYLTDPDETPDPNDFETRIVWPIGPEGELNADRDVLKRRIEQT
jgi:DNA-binding transcriptional MerR regulator